LIRSFLGALAGVVVARVVLDRYGKALFMKRLAPPQIQPSLPPTPAEISPYVGPEPILPPEPGDIPEDQILPEHHADRPKEIAKNGGWVSPDCSKAEFGNDWWEVTCKPALKKWTDVGYGFMSFPPVEGVDISVYDPERDLESGPVYVIGMVIGPYRPHCMERIFEFWKDALPTRQEMLEWDALGRPGVAPYVQAYVALIQFVNSLEGQWSKALIRVVELSLMEL